MIGKKIAVTADRAPRASFVWIALSLLLSGLSVGCGGGPGSRSLHDGAQTDVDVSGDTGASPAPGAGPATAPSSDSADGCWSQEMGCHCANSGQTASCHASVLRDGDYATCSGTRACIDGTWGPCWPPTYETPGASPRRR